MNEANDLWTRATSAFKAGDHVEAIRLFDKLISDGATGPQVYGWRAMALYLDGRYPEAYRGYLDALEVDSQHAPSLHQLAYICACCPDSTMRNGPQAVEYALRACQVTDWQDWKAITVLAAGYAESGNFAAAAEFAEKALKIAPPAEQPERLKRLAQYRAQQPFRANAAHDVANLRYADADTL